MSNKDIIAKIKAEIERRMDKHWEGLPNADAPEDDWTHNELCELGAYKELEHLETFLSTLESEKPINPDDAMKELDEKIALVKQRGSWDGVDVDKFMDEVRGREPEKPINPDEDLNEEIKKFIDEYGYERGGDRLLIAIVARHFAEWQKKMMMDEWLKDRDGCFWDGVEEGKKAMEEQMMKEAVEGKIIFLLNGDVAVNIGDTDEYKLGQKVRIIIVKD